MKKVTGIGGIFFKSPHPQTLNTWYAEHLGIKMEEGWNGALFPWRQADDPSVLEQLVWSPFEATTDYFAPSTASFMINYIVDDLDALLEALQAAGVTIDEKRQDEPYGRFAWIYDPDGNKIELWQPIRPTTP